MSIRNKNIKPEVLKNNNKNRQKRQTRNQTKTKHYKLSVVNIRLSINLMINLSSTELKSFLSSLRFTLIVAVTSHAKK